IFTALDDDLTQLLLDLLAQELRAGNGLRGIDEKFRRARVSLLHKRGRRDSLDNYRGISVVPSLCKVLAHIMTRRLQKLIFDEDLADIEN
ncbi:unnamed protein product, partial [Amoebophrya sp. A120]